MSDEKLSVPAVPATPPGKLELVFGAQVLAMHYAKGTGVTPEVALAVIHQALLGTCALCNGERDELVLFRFARSPLVLPHGVNDVVGGVAALCDQCKTLPLPMLASRIVAQLARRQPAEESIGEA